MLLDLVNAFVIGILVSAPVGAATLFISYFTLKRQWVQVGALALGVSVADGVIALMASLGAKIVERWVPAPSPHVYGVIGVLLICFALYLWHKPPQHSVAQKKQRPFFAFISGFSLTILNPLTAGALVVLFSLFNLSFHGGALHHGLLILSLFLGSCAWWCFLAASIFFMTQKNPHNLEKINRALAIIVLMLALYALTKGMVPLFF